MIIFKDDIPSSFKAVDVCVREIIKQMSTHEVLNDDTIQFKVSFVLRELMNNSVEHGNNFDIKKRIFCYVALEQLILRIEIADEGPGIQTDEVYISDLSDDMRERRRGLKLIEDLDFRVELEDSTIRLDLDIS